MCNIRTHYRDYVVSRPDLHDFLWKQVPRKHIHLGKKIISYDEDSRSVVARCADGTTYYGHILVGADGAYSAVRQHLFKILKGRNVLPASDEAPLSYGCVCLVGQTEVLDTAEFPELNSETSQFNSVLGTENMCTVRVPRGRFARTGRQKIFRLVAYFYFLVNI